MKRRDILEQIAWAQDEYGSMFTGGPIRRRDVMRCVRAGLVVSIGRVREVDGDGIPVEPERWAEGFRLTVRTRSETRGEETK